MLPDVSIIERISRSRESDRDCQLISSATINLGFANEVTWNGSPCGRPCSGSKRIPQTLRNPVRDETKKIVLPLGDQRGLSSHAWPSVSRIQGPPETGTMQRVAFV